MPESATLPPPTKSYVSAEAATIPPPAVAKGGSAQAESQVTRSLPVSEQSEAPKVTVPGYEILRELGRGGMGLVYHARQTRLNRTVALKMILAGGHAGEADLARFQTEAEAVARLQHPGIVQIHETGVHDGLPYFSLEFVEGGSLDRKLNGTPLPPKAAGQFTALLAEAMQAAHEQGIIHRDLKPANVFLKPTRDKDGVPIEDRQGKTRRYLPKIGDFGLAKKLDDTHGQTQTGSVMGTPSYMAPEQAEGRSKRLGPAADVYSLGAILYELLTGRPPFRAATPLETILQVVSDQPVAPTQLNPKTPRDLETICLKCLQKEPTRRYASAQALSEDLGRFLAGEPIHARAVGRIERTWRWCRRNPAVASLLGVVAATLILGAAVSTVLAVYAWSQAEQAEREKLTAQDQKKKADDARADADGERKEAVKARALAEEQRDRAELLVYAGNLGLAQSAWNENNAGLTLRYLEGCQPKLRGWEYWHLKSLYSLHNRRTFRGTTAPNCVAVSSDGKRIISGAFDKLVTVWDADNGQPIHSLKGHSDEILCVAVTPDGKHIVSGSGNRFEPKKLGELKVWETAGGREVRALRGHIGPINSVAISGDGKHVISGGQDKTIKVWDLDSGQEIRTLTGHSSVVLSVAVSADGKRIVSGSMEVAPVKPGELKVWDADTGQQLFALTGHAEGIMCVAIRADGKRIISGGRDKQVKIWDTAQGRELFTLSGHGDSIRGLALSPDGKRIASVSYDANAKIWDADRGQELFTLRGASASCLAFTPDGKHVVAGLTIWDAEHGQEVLTLRGHTRQIFCAAISADGKLVVSGSTDGTYKIWDAHTGQEIRSLKTIQGSAFGCAAISPDGRRVFTGMADRLNVWDVDTGRELTTLKGHKHYVSGVAMSADGRRMVTASHDKTLKVWDVDQGRELQTLKGHQAEVVCVALSPDGKRIVSGSLDGSLKIWDADSAKEVRTLKAHKHWVLCVAFSPDGKRILSGSRDQLLKVWDADSGEAILTLKGHTEEVTGVAMTSIGNRIISSSADQTLKVWESDKGQELVTLRDHKAPVRCLAVSADGKRIVSGTGDAMAFVTVKPGELKVWDVMEHKAAP